MQLPMQQPPRPINPPANLRVAGWLRLLVLSYWGVHKWLYSKTTQQLIIIQQGNSQIVGACAMLMIDDSVPYRESLCCLAPVDVAYPDIGHIPVPQTSSEDGTVKLWCRAAQFTLGWHWAGLIPEIESIIFDARYEPSDIK